MTRPGVVGVLGGTYDPVHLGHLHVAGEVLRAINMERVLFVPCAVPPHKSPPDVTDASHRVAMLRLALGDRRDIELSTVEIDRGGVSYTLETLRQLAEDGRSRPVFIVGMDSLFEIHTWWSWAELLAEFDLVVVDRPGRDLDGAATALPQAVSSRLVRLPEGAGVRVEAADRPGIGGRIFHLPVPPREISSSDVRAAVAAGESLGGLVPPAVARYIREQGLYRQEDRP